MGPEKKRGQGKDVALPKAMAAPCGIPLKSFTDKRGRFSHPTAAPRHAIKRGHSLPNPLCLAPSSTHIFTPPGHAAAAPGHFCPSPGPGSLSAPRLQDTDAYPLWRDGIFQGSLTAHET